MDFKEYCKKTYKKLYKKSYSESSIKNSETRERFAQKRAIRDTMILAFKDYADVDGADVRDCIYSAHINRKSGLKNPDPKLVASIVSADNSWKKSSGHAFEEMIVLHCNQVLKQHGIKIYLQKDLNELIKGNVLGNAARDIKWLKAQIKTSAFDMYITVFHDKKEVVYGCMQTKTSIRDRVTRDREPSIAAMNNFFWSAAVVLDGDFLKLPKFQHMVNGNSDEYPSNGWHGMYVFSKKYSKDRIYSVDVKLITFIDHAKKAADAWCQQRQWLEGTWRAENA